MASEELRSNLSALARTILQRDKVDTTVIAGTDLSAVIEHKTVDVRFLDRSFVQMAAGMEAVRARVGKASKRNVNRNSVVMVSRLLPRTEKQ